jgi:hypothetical protein
MGGKSLIVFEGWKMGFFCFPKNYVLDGVGWGAWRQGMGVFFFVSFFFFIIW